jgi:uncharacterized protein YjiK
MKKNNNGKPNLDMFTRTDKTVFGIFGLVIIVVVILKLFDFPFNTSNAEIASNKTKPKSAKKNKGTNADTSIMRNGQRNLSQVSILKKWELPSELKEVSGISFMDDQRLVCVQDEAGTVFVFNKTSNKIERKIHFAGAGDFEGIALTDHFIYVVRADGKLFEVDINASEKTAPKIYQTSLTAKHNVEGLCYDRDNNRLLLAAKDEAPDMPGYKGIYSFDLASKSLVEKPIFRIDLNQGAFKTSRKKGVMPSAIAIHPVTKDMFITDGPDAKLLVLDKQGNVKELLQLGKDFSQPEGITFSPEAEIFISNEGTKGPGNILMVQMMNAAG